MFILIVGHKGSGKSHIGRKLEKHLGILFFHVEPEWMSYYAECQASGRQPLISEGVARLHPLLVDALRTHEHVCVETTGASAEILNDWLSLTPPSNTLIVRVSAPLELCLERIVARDQTNQVAMDVESIRQVHALSEVGHLQADLTLENVELSEAEIISLFKSALTRASSGPPRQAGSAAHVEG
jgi:shikimate kinase